MGSLVKKQYHRERAGQNRQGRTTEIHKAPLSQVPECRVERGHAPAESRRLSLQVQCRCSNDLVSDARVSARSVFIEDEKQGRESDLLRSTRH